MEAVSPKEFLLFALDHYGFKILSKEGEIIQIENDYTIEIEGNSLFKLLQDGQVIAPFANVEELCNFIKMDIKLNEEN